LWYNWQISNLPSAIVCGEPFHVDHARICRHGGFIIRRYNELRDLEDEMLSMVCHDVGVEPVLQELYCGVLARGANKAPDTRLDVHSHGFWKRQSSAYFDIRVSHPNAESYQELALEQLYRRHENKKNHMYASRVIEEEHATFTPFTTISGGII